MRESTIHARGAFAGRSPRLPARDHRIPVAIVSGAGPALDIIAQQPHVKVVAPRLSFTGLASHGDTTVSFIEKGSIPGPKQSQPRANIVEGSR
jgi:hypothetical protein